MQKQAESLIYYPKKELLSCRLCTDIFKKPITLTCGHTFCYFCLYKFMRQQYSPKSVEKDLQQLRLEDNKQNQNNNGQMPLPLCPTCNSLVLKPIKYYKQNLTLTNLIIHSKLKPQLNFENKVFDDEVTNFNHKILIKIQNPNVQPLPFCYSDEIRFSTCFLDDINEQSHSSYIVIQWPSFKKNIGLAGKILRTEVQYHSSSARSKQNHYRAHFMGLFFVKIQKRKSIQINLNSRYYTQAACYLDNQQLATLNICQCEEYHSENIQPISAFDHFFSFYDTLNNPHFVNQIGKMVDLKPFFQRNNPEAIIYSCIRILRLKSDEKKVIVQSFDDSFRIQKINQYLQEMRHLPIQQIMQISIPGKYSSAFVFGVIFLLILLHIAQNG